MGLFNTEKIKESKTIIFRLLCHSGSNLNANTNGIKIKLGLTRQRGLMLTCERIDLLFDLSCKFKSF